MQKKFCSVLAVFALLLLSSCGASGLEETYAVTTVPDSFVETEVTEVLLESQPATTEQIAEELHSLLYIPGVDVEEMICFFNEVCLDAEVINTGNPQKLQKWVNPIYYGLYGSYTDEDLAVLSGFTQWLNAVEGFPGIQATNDPAQANLRIYFCDQQEMVSRMGDGFYGMDGAVTFWYDRDEIYDAIICYRTDLDQYLRNSVILEEIYNGLGPIQDTSLRTDSIIYSGYSEPQSLTEIDEVILKLLYHPRLVCGMDAEACASVIRDLYY